MVYEVWRADSPFNLSAAFASLDEALAALGRTLEAQGPDFLTRFSLVRKDRRNRRVVVAEGAALVELVRDRQPAPSPAAASVR